MLSIRRATKHDASAVTVIYNHAVEDGVATCDLSVIAEANRASWIESLATPFGVFVAEADSDVVGWVALMPYDQKACFARTATFATYVSRTSRGMGVGTFLREHMLLIARTESFHSLVNRVWANNVASIALAEKFGFTRVGEMKELVYVDGEYIDCIFFQHMLHREEHR